MMKITVAERMTIRDRLMMMRNHLSNNSLVRDKYEYRSLKQGSKYTESFRQYLLNPDGEVISYFHDVPLDLNMADATVNMVVEIPRWTNGKFEINTKLPGNPITQDVKNGKVRFVKNIFPHHGYIQNYGAIPQTWEDPTTKNEEVDLYGDNDPIDVCEISSKAPKLGEIRRVKVLGSLGLIDDGELDWKVIVVDIEDPLSEKLNDILDVFQKCPNLLEKTRQWFRNYKLPDGKPENKFIFNGEFRARDETLKIIQECHENWKKLVEGRVESKMTLPIIENATLKGTPGYGKLDSGAIRDGELERDDTEIPEEVHAIHYV